MNLKRPRRGIRRWILLLSLAAVAIVILIWALYIGLSGLITYTRNPENLSYKQDVRTGQCFAFGDGRMAYVPCTRAVLELSRKENLE